MTSAAGRSGRICGCTHCRSRRKHRCRLAATAPYGCSGCAAHERARPARNADLEQNLAVERALAHRVIAVVGAIERVVGPHVHAVGATEYALAPRLEEVAVAVEHAHRMFAAVEHIDAILAVDADRADVAEFPAC